MLMLAIGGGLIGCRKEKKDKQGDMGHGVVTTVEVYLVQGSDTVKGRYKDPDGVGGRPPSVDTLRPKVNTFYRYSLRVLNESGNPVQDLTQTIIEQQKNTHRFFLLPIPEDTMFLKVEGEDRDDYNRLVSSRGTWRQGTTIPPEGGIRIILRHYLDPSDKEGGLDRGTSDIDVKIPIRPRL